MTSTPSIPGPGLSLDVASAHVSEHGRWSPGAVFGALAVFALCLRLACLTGLIGSDDLQYARYARALMEGHYGETLAEARTYERIHHGLRYGVIIPVAGVYKIFGVSEWTTIVLPLLASTLSVVLVAAIARRLFDMRVAIIAALLYATFPMELRLATMLLPEPIAECFLLLAVLAYLHAPQRGAGLWLASGALVGAAYLAKEPALFVGGALVLHAAWERRWRSAMLVALGLACVVAAEHAYYVWGQGDLLFRPHSTQLHSLDLGAAPAPAPRRHIEYGLFTRYPQMMLEPGVSFGLHSLASLILAAAALALKPRRGYALLVLWAVLPWLYLNFGSWSLQQYVLLPREPRYIMFTYPPLMLLSGVVLSRALAARTALAWPMAMGLGVVLLVGVMSGLATRGQTARAEEMSVLREIVRATQRMPGQTIYTDDIRWSRALPVLNGSLIATSPATATYVLQRGPLDLPVILHRPSMQNHSSDVPR